MPVVLTAPMQVKSKRYKGAHGEDHWRQACWKVLGFLGVSKPINRWAEQSATWLWKLMAPYTSTWTWCRKSGSSVMLGKFISVRAGWGIGLCEGSPLILCQASVHANKCIQTVAMATQMTLNTTNFQLGQSHVIEPFNKSCWEECLCYDTDWIIPQVKTNWCFFCCLSIAN